MKKTFLLICLFIVPSVVFAQDLNGFSGFRDIERQVNPSDFSAKGYPLVPVVGKERTYKRANEVLKVDGISVDSIMYFFEDDMFAGYEILAHGQENWLSFKDLFMKGFRPAKPIKNTDDEKVNVLTIDGGMGNGTATLTYQKDSQEIKLSVEYNWQSMTYDPKAFNESL